MLAPQVFLLEFCSLCVIVLARQVSHAANTACLWAEDLKYFVIPFHLHSHEELLLQQHTEFVSKGVARGPACLEATVLHPENE